MRVGVSRHDLPQALAPAGQTGHHRAAGNVQHRGDFRIAHVLQRHQQHDFALFRREPFQRGLQILQLQPVGQSGAGYALGFSYWQVMRYVILPQAFRNMLPVLLTQTVILFQDVSLVYIISLPDLVTIASKIAQRDGRLVEMYVFVAVVYFAICLVLSHGVKRLQAKLAVGR